MTLNSLEILPFYSNPLIINTMAEDLIPPRGNYKK